MASFNGVDGIRAVDRFIRVYSRGQRRNVMGPDRQSADHNNRAQQQIQIFLPAAEFLLRLIADITVHNTPQFIPLDLDFFWHFLLQKIITRRYYYTPKKGGEQWQ